MYISILLWPFPLPNPLHGTFHRLVHLVKPLHFNQTCVLKLKDTVPPPKHYNLLSQLANHHKAVHFYLALQGHNALQKLKQIKLYFILGKCNSLRSTIRDFYPGKFEVIRKQQKLQKQSCFNPFRIAKSLVRSR